MLLAGRSDFFCEVDLALLNELYTPQFKSAAAPRRLFDLADAAPLYPYLHRCRAELAPRMAATLRQLKAEGLIERFRVDALRSVSSVQLRLLPVLRFAPELGSRHMVVRV